MFGPRAAHVHKMFQDAKASEDTLSSISSQMGLMAQLRHIVTELKVRPSRQLPGGHAFELAAHVTRTVHLRIVLAMCTAGGR